MKGSIVSWCSACTDASDMSSKTARESDPCRNSSYLGGNTDLSSMNCLKAGYLELSEYSMLSAPRTNVYAVSNLPAEYIAEMTDADQEIQIEQWIYDPSLFGKNGSVDPISFYLSLRDDPDERVQEALEDMV